MNPTRPAPVASGGWVLPLVVVGLATTPSMAIGAPQQASAAEGITSLAQVDCNAEFTHDPPARDAMNFPSCFAPSFIDQRDQSPHFSTPSKCGNPNDTLWRVPAFCELCSIHRTRRVHSVPQHSPRNPMKILVRAIVATAIAAAAATGIVGTATVTVTDDKVDSSIHAGGVGFDWD